MVRYPLLGCTPAPATCPELLRHAQDLGHTPCRLCSRSKVVPPRARFRGVSGQGPLGAVGSHALSPPTEEPAEFPSGGSLGPELVHPTSWTPSLCAWLLRPQFPLSLEGQRGWHEVSVRSTQLEGQSGQLCQDPERSSSDAHPPDGTQDNSLRRDHCVGRRHWPVRPGAGSKRQRSS